MNKIGKNHDNIIKIKHEKTLKIEGTLHENLRYYSMKIEGCSYKIWRFSAMKIEWEYLTIKNEAFCVKSKNETRSVFYKY